MNETSEQSCRATVITGRRTTLKEGMAPHYLRIHSQIPLAVEQALRASGVVRWNIWRDGQSLFHCIETTEGYDAMFAAITALGPIDQRWDLLISSLLESDPSADMVLERVWAMDPEGQS